MLAPRAPGLPLSPRKRSSDWAASTSDTLTGRPARVRLAPNGRYRSWGKQERQAGQARVLLLVLCASVASPLSDARIARRAGVERAEPLGCLWIGCRGVRCRGCVAVEGDALMVEDRALHGVARRPACAGPEPCRSFCAWSTSGPTHARWPESACVRQTSWSPVFLRWSGSSSFSGQSVRNLSGVCLAPDAANVTVSVFVRGSILPDATLTMTEPWTCTGTPAQLNSNSGPKWPTG
jgi:hypothetical protein